MQRSTWKKLTSIALFLALPAVARADNPTLNGWGVLGGWNHSAGISISTASSEAYANAKGWDYRVNFPLVRHTSAEPNARSTAALVGVVEDTTYDDVTLSSAEHMNNSIWMFEVDLTGTIRFKILPSRRSATSNATTNITSLTTGWYRVGPSGGPAFALEKPAATVLGAGIGGATIFVSARASDGRVLMTWRAVDAENISTWSTPWIEVAPATTQRPAMTTAFGDRIALAWRVSGGTIASRLYQPSAATFGPVITAATSAGSPQLIWDGTALNLLYIGPSFAQNVWHRYATSAVNYAFQPASQVTSSTLNASCDAIAFNRRLHVTCARLSGGQFHVWYSTSTTPFGTASSWSPEQLVGLDDHSEPQLGAVNDQLYIVAPNFDGRLQYARKDPHVLPYEYSGGAAPTDQWLEVGTPIDNTLLQLFSPEILSFNSDLYLASHNSSDGLYLVNFSRAAVKRLITDQLGIDLRWGSDNGSGQRIDNDPITDPGPGTSLVIDITGDGRDDYVFAAQDASLFVAESDEISQFNASEIWVPIFQMGTQAVRAARLDNNSTVDLTLSRHINGAWSVWRVPSTGRGIGNVNMWSSPTPSSSCVPLFGDVNADQLDDLVFACATAGGGPVYAALNDGTTFGTPVQWRAAMLQLGKTPALADINGDGRDDLIAVPDPSNADRDVRAALSNGSSFGTVTTWRSAYPTMCSSSAFGDFDQNGREDLVCFVRESAPLAPYPNGVLVAYAGTASFGSLAILISHFSQSDDIYMIGNIDGYTKGHYTGVAADYLRPLVDIVRRNPSNNNIRIANGGGQFPTPSGAPWERYRFFTEKGVGVAMFPEWIWTEPCASQKFLLMGGAGSGDGLTTRLSVNPGSQQGHVLEELGHSVFDNCIDNDRFGLESSIKTTPIAMGGFNSNDMSDSCSGTMRISGEPSWIDCRDPEHYFLSFMKTYRVNGEEMRASIAAVADAGKRSRYIARYDWLRNNWFNGAEYYRDTTVSDARKELRGLLCLPNICSSL